AVSHHEDVLAARARENTVAEIRTAAECPSDRERAAEVGAHRFRHHRAARGANMFRKGKRRRGVGRKWKEAARQNERGAKGASHKGLRRNAAWLSRERCRIRVQSTCRQPTGACGSADCSTSAGPVLLPFTGPLTVLRMCYH